MFKVGDRVKVKMTGATGKIALVDYSWSFPYEIDSDVTGRCIYKYTDAELELICNLKNIFKIGDKVIVDSMWLPQSILPRSKGTIIKAENYPTAGWVVEFSNGTRGTFEENELTPATIASNVKGKDVTLTIDGKKFNPCSNFEYEMDFYNTKEEEKEEESEGDQLLQFFATPAGQWKGKK